MVNINNATMQGAIMGAIGGLAMNLYVVVGEVKWTLIKAILALWQWVVGFVGVEGINIQFSTIDVDISGSISGLAGSGVAQWIAETLGVSIPGNGFELGGIVGLHSGVLLSVLGAGVLFAVAGAILAYANQLKGSKFMRYFMYVLGSHVLAFLLLTGLPGLNIDTFNWIIVLLINALVVAWLFENVIEPLYKGVSGKMLLP